MLINFAMGGVQTDKKRDLLKERKKSNYVEGLLEKFLIFKCLRRLPIRLFQNSLIIGGIGNDEK